MWAPVVGGQNDDVFRAGATRVGGNLHGGDGVDIFVVQMEIAPSNWCVRELPRG